MEQLSALLIVVHGLGRCVSIHVGRCIFWWCIRTYGGYSGLIWAPLRAALWRSCNTYSIRTIIVINELLCLLVLTFLCINSDEARYTFRRSQVSALLRSIGVDLNVLPDEIIARCWVLQHDLLFQLVQLCVRASSINWQSRDIFCHDPCHWRAAVNSFPA